MGIVAALGLGLMTPVLRAKSVNADVPATLGDMRTVISAEATYQTVNFGAFDKLECLHRPSECLAGYQGPPFLYGFLEPVRRRYQREFHPGPAVAVVPPGGSPSSLESYAFVAIPISDDRVGFLYRYPAFCGDSTGALCRTARPGRPAVVRGACVVTPGSPPGFFARWVEDLVKDRPVLEPCYLVE